MAWIESHQGLATHPKVFRLASLIGCDIDICISKLHRLWWWCLSYAEDGDLSRFNPEEIGLGIGIDDKEEAIKFLDALKQSKWIDKDNFLHDWLDYAGRYLKSKYHTSNPLKYENILNKHLGRTKGKTKGKPKGSNSKTSSHTHNIHNIDKKNNIDKPFFEKAEKKSIKRPTKEEINRHKRLLDQANQLREQNLNKDDESMG